MFKISPTIGLLWESESNDILTDVTGGKTKGYFARSMAVNVNYCVRKKLTVQ